MEEFIINDFLSLKFDKKTTIYIKGKPFDICKHLTLVISLNDGKDFMGNSIDEAAEKYDSQELLLEIPPPSFSMMILESVFPLARLRRGYLFLTHVTAAGLSTRQWV